MFIWRHPALRVYILRTTPTHTNAFRLLSTYRAVRTTFGNDRPRTLLNPSANSIQGHTTSFHALAVKPPRLSTHATLTTISDEAASRTTDIERGPESVSFSPTDLHDSYIPSADSLDVQYICKPLKGAVNGNELRMHKLTKGVIEESRGFNHEDRVHVLEKILEILAYSERLHRRTINLVLQELQSMDVLGAVSFRTLEQLVRKLLDVPPSKEYDTAAFCLLTPVFTDYVLQAASDARQVFSWFPPSRAVWVLFKMMMRLLYCEQQRQVLDILTSLFSEKVIPEDALHASDLSEENFSLSVMTVIARCCIQWGWHSRAAYLLQTTLDWNTRLPTAVEKIIADTIHSILEDDSPSNVRRASDLILRYIASPHLILPDATLARFYERANPQSSHALALTVYKRSRSREGHRYPLPHSRLLLPLLRRCAAKKDVHGMRTLVTHVVEDNAFLPEAARAPFIKLCASHGFMSAARRLWTRAAEEKDRNVIANAGVLVRVVSLVESRIRNRQRRLQEQLSSAVPDGASSQLPSSVSAQTTPHSSTADNMNPVDPISDVIDPPDLVEGDAEDHQTTSYQEEINEYRAFTVTVIRTFVKHKKSLYKAQHWELNALARAFILSGRPVKGMKILKYILARREVPELHDVNVALSSVAVTSPSGAARIIQDMVGLGLKPDKVTFGTVIHHALRHGDMALVDRLIARAREHGITELSYKTTGSLIRACVSNADDGSTPTSRLQRAKHLMDSLVAAGEQPSANMGSDCVVVALRASQPVMAFDFWHSFVRDKVQWDDPAHAKTRQQIARPILKKWASGQLDTKRVREMLVLLGQKLPQELQVQANGPPTNSKFRKSPEH